MTKPLIGLPGRRKKGASIAGFPGALTDTDLDLYFTGYARAIIQAGGIPLHLPVDLDPLDIIDRLDGVLLSGGADIVPSRYGQAPDGNGDYDEGRDTREFTLLEAAIQRELPVLGICRGHQIINVHRGGTLHQHVPEHAFFESDPNHRVHEISVTPGSMLHDYYANPIKVNSLHHQTIDQLGAGLVAVGTDQTGSIEAIEDPERLLLGVQWHPEMHAEREPIFDWLILHAATAKASST